MPALRKRHTRPLIVKATELAFSAPQVIAHRVTRMALAGAYPSSRDRKEFQRMGAEKSAAFMESWNAMAVQGLRAQHTLAMSLWRSLWQPWLWGQPFTRVASNLHNTALGVLAKGLAPVHQRAVANARRLAGTKLR